MTEASLAQHRRPSGIDRQQAIRANIVVHTKMSESYNENEPHFRPENKAIVRSILPHWFLAQGPVSHGQSFEDAEIIDRYLATVLPMSLHLYKYLRFIMAR